MCGGFDKFASFYINVITCSKSSFILNSHKSENNITAKKGRH